jgi:pantetheine-phosphate adenylyltransferase
MVNSEKRPMFTPAQRLELAQEAVAHLPNVRAQVWEGLLADFAESVGAKALVKGVRGSVDFDWETQLAQINRSLSPGLDTVFLPARPEYAHISSTMVREMIRYHRPLATCMPAGSAEILRRFGEGKESYGK